MQRFLLGATLFLAAGMTGSNAAGIEDEPLDLSAVTAVSITGEASSVNIGTLADGPYRGTIRRHRTGWFARWNSSWAYDDCSAAARMRIEGSLLRIDVGRSSWFGFSDCAYDVDLNVRKQTAVAIDQQALQARLSGDFSTVAIAAKAGDIALSGHADGVSLQGDALRAGIAFGTSDGRETVTIDARLLDADIDLSAAPVLAYSVTAKASFVDTIRQNTVGAKPSVIITGDLVRATIR